MNFRISIGDTGSFSSFGKVLHETKDIHIESDFHEMVTFKISIGSIICLGSLTTKDKSQDIKSCLVKINEKSFHSVVNELEGRFLLFLVTPNALYARSDQFGKIDIYYQQSQSGITLTSNLDLLPENPARDGFNQAGLVHMLTYYGYCPPKKETLYNSVKRLGINESLHIQNGRLKTIKQDVTLPNSQNYAESKHDEYADIFLGQLKESASDLGNLVFLSSGWDSTSILAGLVHIVGKDKVSGLIGRMKYSERSGCCNQIEIDKAKRFAEYYDIKLEVVDFDLTKKDDDYFRCLRAKMRRHQLYAMTGITHDKLGIRASELTNKNETVFAGEISDGAHNLGFSQYATIFHPSHGFREYSDKMASYLFGPTFLSLLISGQYLDDPIYQLFKARYDNDTVFDDIESSPEDIKLQLLSSMFLRDARMPLWSLNNNRLLTPEGVDIYTESMQQSYLTEIASVMDVNNIYACYLYLYNSFHWQGSTVRSLQTMSDYYSLDTKLPFWNSKIQDFLAKMPETWGRGLDLKPTKYPLKKMLQLKLDYPYDYQEGAHSYTYDVDHTFNHAQEVYSQSILVEDFQDSVRDKPYHKILSKDYFDLDYIDALVDEYIKSPKSMSVESIGELVPIIMLCYVGWYE